MERVTPGKPLSLKLGVNHETKALDVVVTGNDGTEAKGALSIDDIDRLMAHLSQCQHALVLSKAGGEQLTSPFDPEKPLEAQEGHILANHDAISRHEVGVDDTEGTVNLLVLGSSGRLSGHRMSPERARQLADQLLRAAGQITVRPTRSFDA
jgi:hypothetical protein